MNETDLVQGLRERNPAAVQQLHECWLPSVWRFVYVRVGQDQHLAEDIVSETMLALIKAAGQPEAEINNLGGWLRTVAGNKVNDHFRAAARVQHLIQRVSKNAETKETVDPVNHQETEERRTQVRKIMDQLPEQYRITLEWKYIEKLSVREIASRINLTEKSVESILFRARNEFRHAINIHDQVSDRAGKQTKRQNCCESSRNVVQEDLANPECSASDHPKHDVTEVKKANQ